MRQAVFVLLAIGILALGGCSRFGAESSFRDSNVRIGSVPEGTVSGGTPPSIAVATNSSLINLGSFVDRGAVSKLSDKDRTEAASAQYYALQFGRAGAPRSWQGDSGANGQVSVGPYVRVNLLDCRDFTHVVTISGATYSRTGTACREADGSWDVASS